MKTAFFSQWTGHTALRTEVSARQQPETAWTEHFLFLLQYTRHLWEIVKREQHKVATLKSGLEAEQNLMMPSSWGLKLKVCLSFFLPFETAVRVHESSDTLAWRAVGAVFTSIHRSAVMTVYSPPPLPSALMTVIQRDGKNVVLESINKNVIACHSCLQCCTGWKVHKICPW